MGNAVSESHFVDSKAQGDKVVKYSTNSSKALKHKELLEVVCTSD